MIHPDVLIEQFRITHWVLTQQTKGLNHAESLIQPSLRGNCLNWVLGHILASRNGILELLDQEPVLPEASVARYARGSEPIIGEAEDVLPLESLLELLERSQQRLMAGLEAATPDRLSEADDTGRTIGQKLGFLFFHEAYHSGQTELLRQLAGRDDAVIR